ncbi:MAG: PEP-CTERM sorting domain-containing protein, partial [Nitrosospira sp.]|nr:PEP-CTERM sorting domain-containing protein [Nitrosospira sp.]
VLEATASDDASDTLASAGSKFTGPGSAGFNLGEVVRTKLQTGADLNGNNADGSLDINFGNAWELDFNATPSNAESDFYSTLFHEFTHVLGFASTIGQSGEPVFGTQNAGSWSTFDSFIVDKNGARIIDPATFALNQAAWDAGSVGGASPAEGLFFDGANAVAANGGDPAGLYTPETWDESSSVSHLDDENPAYAGMMMLAMSDTGPYARDYSAIEVGMLTDLGYTAAIIPEPETYAMLLAGLGMIGWIARRRKA